MYYELAKIRQYKDNKGQPYFQIRVKKGSKLTDKALKVNPIALVNVDEIQEMCMRILLRAVPVLLEPLSVS